MGSLLRAADATAPDDTDSDLGLYHHSLCTLALGLPSLPLQRASEMRTRSWTRAAGRCPRYTALQKSEQQRSKLEHEDICSAAACPLAPRRRVLARIPIEQCVPNAVFAQRILIMHGQVEHSTAHLDRTNVETSLQLLRVPVSWPPSSIYSIVRTMNFHLMNLWPCMEGTPPIDQT